MMDVAIVGIGLHDFGRSPHLSGLQQGARAVCAALDDAGLQWKDMQFAFGGSQDSGNADALVQELGLTGLQFTNVWNGCATGGSALQAACAAIKSGEYDLGVAVGFDKHARGAFNPRPADWGLDDWYGEAGLMLTTQYFAMRIQRYMHDHGIAEDSLVRVAEKNFHNGSLNPRAWRREALSYEQIAASAMVNHPLRKYMFCSPAEGAAAVVLCRADKVGQLARKPVYIKAAVVRTRRYGSLEVFSPALPAGPVWSTSTSAASKAAYEMAGAGPGDIDIAQLQDTDSGAEIIHMAENGLCEHGEQQTWLRNGDTRIGGRLPVNTDGGCMANGEPVGASGLRQIHEICLQLRGDAGARQVPGNPKVGYAHTYGAPGVSSVSILQV